MMRRRFYAPPYAFAHDANAVTLAPEEARHLRDVLRLKKGDEVFVFDGEGREYRCVVGERDGDKNSVAHLEVREEVEAASPESLLQLTLCVALLKNEKFEMVVQKATELGVMCIVPVTTTRADVRVRDAVADAAKRRARWQRVALEAAKQSGRARAPRIEEAITFDELLKKSVLSGETSAGQKALRVMFAERMGDKLFNALDGSRAEKFTSITALVGPEGGWTNEEIANAREAGWHVITLGGRILRAETAAITVTTLLQYLCGDLR